MRNALVGLVVPYAISKYSEGGLRADWPETCQTSGRSREFRRRPIKG